MSDLLNLPVSPLHFWAGHPVSPLFSCIQELIPAESLMQRIGAFALRLSKAAWGKFIPERLQKMGCHDASSHGL